MVFVRLVFGVFLAVSFDASAETRLLTEATDPHHPLLSCGSFLATTDLRDTLPFYPVTEQHVLRAHQLEDGFWHEEVLLDHFDDGGPTFVRRTRRTQYRGLPGIYFPEGRVRRPFKDEAEWFAHVQRMAAGHDRFVQLLTDIRRFSDAIYRDRLGWDEGTRGGLVESTAKYANDVTAVEVYSRHPHRRIGTALMYERPYGWENGQRVPRGPFVLQRYGRPAAIFRTKDARDALPTPTGSLPITDTLGIEVPVPREVREPELWRKIAPKEWWDTPGGVDLEVGAFAVDESAPLALQSRAWAALTFHVAMWTRERTRPLRNDYPVRIYGFAERGVTERRYRAMNMELLREMWVNGEHRRFARDADVPVFPATHRGWRAMVLHPIGLREFLIDVDSSVRSGLKSVPAGSFFQTAVKTHDTDALGDTPQLLAALDSPDISERDAEIVFSHISDILNYRDTDRQMAAALEGSEEPLSRAEISRRAVARADAVIEGIRSRREALMNHPSREVRRLMAWSVGAFGRSPLGWRFAIEQVLLPLLAGEDDRNRREALLTYRLFLIREQLAEGLAVAGLTESERRTQEAGYRAILAEAGWTAETIDDAVKKIRGYTASTFSESHEHWPRYGSDVVEPLFRALIGKPLETAAALLRLALLEEAPFPERVLNLEPYPG